MNNIIYLKRTLYRAKWILNKSSNDLFSVSYIGLSGSVGSLSIRVKRTSTDSKGRVTGTIILQLNDASVWAYSWTSVLNFYEEDFVTLFLIKISYLFDSL